MQYKKRRNKSPASAPIPEQKSKFKTNDLVEVPNGNRYYIAKRAKTSDDRWAYQMSLIEVPNFCGKLNLWYTENQLELVCRAQQVNDGQR